MSNITAHGFDILGPDTAPACQLATMGNVPPGTYRYKVSYMTHYGETLTGPASLAVVATSLQSVIVADIPVRAAGNVIGRYIYRSNGGPYLRVATINDNTTTTFRDTAATGSVPEPDNESFASSFALEHGWIINTRAQIVPVATIAASAPYTDVDQYTQVVFITATGPGLAVRLPPTNANVQGLVISCISESSETIMLIPRAGFTITGSASFPLLAASTMSFVMRGTDWSVLSGGGSGGSGLPAGVVPPGGDLDGSYPAPTLRSIYPGGTYGDATTVPQVTYNQKGLVTSIVDVPITFPPGATLDDLASPTYPTDPATQGIWYGSGTKAVSNASSVVIGNGAGGAANTTAVGTSAVVVDGSSAFGASSVANGLNSTAIGNGASANNQGATAIGYQSSAQSINSIALGSSSAANTNAFAAGDQAFASGVRSIAIGNTASASANDSIAVGASQSTSNSSIAIGVCLASADTAVAIGRDANASATSAIAIGMGAAAPVTESISIGTTSILNGILAIGSGHTCNGGNAITIGRSNAASANFAIAFGNNVTAGGASSIAIGSNSVSANGSTSIALGSGSTSAGPSAIAIGSNTSAAGASGIAFGPNASAGGANTFALGSGASANVTGAVTIGGSATTTSTNGVAIGSSANAAGTTNAIAIGLSANAGGATNPIAIGALSTAGGTLAVALGPTTQAAGGSSIAIGAGALTNVTGGVAIGASASATVFGSIAIGNTATCAGAANAFGVAVNAASRVPGTFGVTVNGSAAQIPCYASMYSAIVLTSAGTTTLAYSGANSSKMTYFSGNFTQNIVLPPAIAGALGYELKLVNQTAGLLSIYADAGLTQLVTQLAAAVPAVSRGGWGYFTIVATGANTAASWSAELGSTSL